MNKGYAVGNAELFCPLLGLLAERGFCCTGVDFSPASIAWARQQAQAAGLDIAYHQQDVRDYAP